MVYSPLSKQQKEEIQNRIRGEKALELCIAMMVSDRVIHKLELELIYEMLNENILFANVSITDDALLDLISNIQKQRSQTTLKEMISKYSAINDNATRETIMTLLKEVMKVDGKIDEKEIETILILKELWDI